MLVDVAHLEVLEEPAVPSPAHLAAYIWSANCRHRTCLLSCRLILLLCRGLPLDRWRNSERVSWRSVSRLLRVVELLGPDRSVAFGSRREGGCREPFVGAES